MAAACSPRSFFSFGGGCCLFLVAVPAPAEARDGGRRHCYRRRCRRRRPHHVHLRYRTVAVTKTKKSGTERREAGNKGAVPAGGTPSEASGPAPGVPPVPAHTPCGFTSRGAYAVDVIVAAGDPGREEDDHDPADRGVQEEIKLDEGVAATSPAFLAKPSPATDGGADGDGDGLGDGDSDGETAAAGVLPRRPCSRRRRRRRRRRIRETGRADPSRWKWGALLGRYMRTAWTPSSR